MTYDQFVGQVQRRAQLGSLGDTVSAIRATLETLAERLTDDEARNLASQLPREVAVYVLGSVLLQPDRMRLDDFFDRVTLREGINPSDAIYHARVVLEMVGETVSGSGEMDDVLSQLPQEFRDFIESGDEGEFREAA